MINQLFRQLPSEEIATRLVRCFGPAGLHDMAMFSKDSMRQYQTVQKIENNLLDDLKTLYIKCKAESYLNDINEQSALTILRQVLRARGYILCSRSKCRNGERLYEYQIVKQLLNNI